MLMGTEDLDDVFDKNFNVGREGKGRRRNGFWVMEGFDARKKRVNFRHERKSRKGEDKFYKGFLVSNPLVFVLVRDLLTHTGLFECVHGNFLLYGSCYLLYTKLYNKI